MAITVYIVCGVYLLFHLYINGLSARKTKSKSTWSHNYLCVFVSVCVRACVCLCTCTCLGVFVCLFVPRQWRPFGHELHKAHTHSHSLSPFPSHSLSLAYSRFISLFRFLPVEWKRLELGQAGSNKKSSAPLVILIPAESLSRKIAKGSQLGRCTWWTSKWTDGPTDRWKQSEEIQARPAQARAQTVGCGLTYISCAPLTDISLKYEQFPNKQTNIHVRTHTHTYVYSHTYSHVRADIWVNFGRLLLPLFAYSKYCNMNNFKAHTHRI